MKSQSRQVFGQLIAFGTLLLPAFAVFAQADKAQVSEFIEARADNYAEVAQHIWDLAEVGYLENESSALLQRELAAAGFEISAGVAGIPTAFVASWRSGAGPTVGILAEYQRLGRHHFAS